MKTSLLRDGLLFTRAITYSKLGILALQLFTLIIAIGQFLYDMVHQYGEEHEVPDEFRRHQ